MSRNWAVESLTALGVTVNNRLSAAEHVTNVLLLSCLPNTLRILRTLLAVWRFSRYSRWQASVLLTSMVRVLLCCRHLNRLDAFLKRCKRYGYCPDDVPNISELFSDADDQLFSRISHNVTHVLKPLLPTQTQHSYIIWETDVTTLY